MAAARLTVGGYYNHFASKEALATEACTSLFDKEARVWRSLLADLASTDTALKKLARWYLAADTACPIIAFNQDAATISSYSLAKAYACGTRLLLDTVLEAADSSVTPGPSRDQVLFLFAALTGARLLGRSAAAETWVQDLQKAVLRSL
jgi:TetR/AcrR family transcriptional repressor of nem operon